MKLEGILEERQSTHGDYNEVSRISQALRDVFKSGSNWERLNDCQREAIEMMCSKFGRIMSGNFNFQDHWEDLAGYAKLGQMFSLEKPVDKTAKVSFSHKPTTQVVKLNLEDLDATIVGS